MSDTPTIKPSTNGPYLVTNCRSLKGLADALVHNSIEG